MASGLFLIYFYNVILFHFKLKKKQKMSKLDQRKYPKNLVKRQHFMGFSPKQDWILLQSTKRDITFDKNEVLDKID